jgi:hypothetical protein
MTDRADSTDWPEKRPICQFVWSRLHLIWLNQLNWGFNLFSIFTYFLLYKYFWYLYFSADSANRLSTNWTMIQKSHGLVSCWFLKHWFISIIIFQSIQYVSQYEAIMIWSHCHPLISNKLFIGGGRLWNSSVGSWGESCGSWIYWFTCSFHPWWPIGVVHTNSFSEWFYVFLIFTGGNFSPQISTCIC